MHLLKSLAAILLTSTALCWGPAASAATLWDESAAGAGSTLATAETPFGNLDTSLTGINGWLRANVPVGGSPRYEVDLFRIQINDWMGFSARTLFTGFDTALFLFDAAGQGVYSNDDDATAADLTSFLPSGSATGPSANGIYFLAIAFGGFGALDVNGLSLFSAGGFDEVLGAEAGSGPLDAWFGPDSFEESPWAYTIELTGVGAMAVPAPNSLALLLIAGVALWGNRRLSALGKTSFSGVRHEAQ